MNAQQLIQDVDKQSFGDFKVFFKSLSKHNNDDRGDKFVARTGNKHQQVSSEGSFSNSLENVPIFIPSPHSLMPRTSDLLSQLNINNIKNTETLKGDVIRSMGIEVL
jgi:hypothetical protein